VAGARRGVQLAAFIKRQGFTAGECHLTAAIEWDEQFLAILRGVQLHAIPRRELDLSLAQHAGLRRTCEQGQVMRAAFIQRDTQRGVMGLNLEAAEVVFDQFEMNLSILMILIITRILHNCPGTI
jgi:hypothetical protein